MRALVLHTAACIRKHAVVPCLVAPTLLLLACGEIAPSPDGATPNGASSGGTPIPTIPGVPVTPERPLDFTNGCPATFPMPADCGADSARCGNASLIALGDPGVLRGLAVDGSFVYWQFAHGLATQCKGAIYRSPATGGDAELFAPVQAADVEAFGGTVYWTELDGVYAANATRRTFRKIADPPFGRDYTTFLARSAFGVVAYPSNGAWEPKFFHLDPVGMRQVAPALPQHYLGSVPEFDGSNVWLTTSAATSAANRWALQSVANGSGAVAEHALNASTRNTRTVVSEGDAVYFTTGDWSSTNGSLTAPMALQRLHKSTGRTEAIFSEQNVYIRMLDVDASEVFFVVSSIRSTGSEIRAMKTDGTGQRTLWRGDTYPEKLRASGDSVYFTIPWREPYPMPSIGGAVLRVAKSSTL